MSRSHRPKDIQAIRKELVDRETWENIGDIFTAEGRKKLRKGQILGFMQDGVQNHYKIMQRRNEKIMVKKITVYTPEEVDNMEDDERNALYEDGK